MHKDVNLWHRQSTEGKNGLPVIKVVVAHCRFFTVVQSFSVSSSFRPHGLQHAILPCLALSPKDCSNSCPLSRWCHPAISSSVTPFSSCPQSFPASRTFPMSQLCTLGGQSIGASASASVLPMNIQDWFPLGLTGLISLLSKGLLKVFSSTTVQKHQFFTAQPSLWSHICTWILWENHSFEYTELVGKVTSLLFNMLFRLVIAFLLRCKHLLISLLQSWSTVILDPRKQVCHCFYFFPINFPGSDRTGCHDLIFWNVEFGATFFTLLLTSSRGCLVSPPFQPLWWCHLHIWGYWYFFWQSSFQLVLHPVWHFEWCTLHKS